MGLFDQPYDFSGVQDPAASYGMSPAAAAPAPAAATPAPATSPWGNGGFSQMVNTLGGALPEGGLSDISNGLQTLAYGIGAFAKDPRRREMYIQAGQAHAAAMSKSKEQHLAALQAHASSIADLLAKSNGNPQVLAAAQPVMDQLAASADVLGGKDIGNAIRLQFQVAGTAVNKGDLVPVPGPDGKPVYGYATPGQPYYEKDKVTTAESALGKIQDDLKAGRITPEMAQALIKKETYIAPAAEGPAQWGAPYKDPATGQIRQVSSKGEIRTIPSEGLSAVVAPVVQKIRDGKPVTPEEYKAVQIFLNMSPQSQMAGESLNLGPRLTTGQPGGAPAAPPQALPSATAPGTMQPAPAATAPTAATPPQEGQTGTTPDGTKWVYRGGRWIKA